MNRRSNSCPRSNRLLLHGSFLGDNFGDTLLLRIFRDRIDNLGYDINMNVTRASRHSAEFAGLQSIGRVKALFLSGPVLFCGGGYFGEPPRRRARWSIRCWRRHILLGLSIMLQRRPYTVQGVGFGPLSKWWIRWPILLLMRRAKSVSVRDEKSSSYLSSYAKGKARHIVSADAVLSVPQDYLEALAAQSSSSGSANSSQKTMLVHLPGPEYTQRARKMVASAVMNEANANDQFDIIVASDSKVGFEPSFFQWFRDGGLGGRVFFHPFRGPSDLLQLISSTDWVITSKLHVGVCAAVMRKAMLAFPNHHKTKRFYQQIGRDELCVSHDSLNARDLKPIISDLAADRIPPVSIPPVVKRDADRIWRKVSLFLNESGFESAR